MIKLDEVNTTSAIPPIKIVSHPDVKPELPWETFWEEALTERRGKKVINEHTFAQGYTGMNHLRYGNGVFYNEFGMISEDDVLKDIYDTIGQFIQENLAAKSKSILECVKIEANQGTFNVNPRLIPFRNGDMYITKRGWTFHENRLSEVPYRLSVDFRSFENTLPSPHFDKWLNDLFEKEDQLTLQEYLGYCLLPTTSAQEALFLIGDGGSGKSVIGSILQAIFGDSMLAVDNMHDFLEDKFKIPELENKLVLYDDDLKESALTDTGFFKKLITNTGYITADRKYAQPFKFKPYTRIVACANYMLSSRFDSSEGFYRRLHPLVIKPKPDDRKVIRGFDAMVAKEAEAIVQWALVGLYRLIKNNYILTCSKKTEQYMSSVKSLANHFPDFMESCFTVNAAEKVSTKEINDLYRVWCAQNSIDERKQKALQKWLTDNMDRYHISPTTHVKRNGKDVRGFQGISIKPEWDNFNTIRLE